MGFLFLLLFLNVWPACPAEGWITSPYGARRHPITHRKKFHYGVDIGNAVGTEVRSPWAGRVLKVQRDSAMGLHILVKSGPYKLTFAHLESTAVRRGDQVARGGLLGRMGRTGRVTGPHLHLEVRKGGRIQNPSVALLSCPTSP